MEYNTWFIIFPKTNAATLAPKGWALKINPIKSSDIPLVLANKGKNGVIIAREIDEMRLQVNSNLNKVSVFIVNKIIKN